MRVIMRTIRRLPLMAIECLVCGYRVVLSPLLIGNCKFHPTCSEYFLEAIHEWGALRGSCLGFKRLIRCHPFSIGGLDPVPKRGIGSSNWMLWTATLSRTVLRVFDDFRRQRFVCGVERPVVRLRA